MIKSLTLICLLTTLFCAPWKWPENPMDPPTLELDTESKLEGKVVLERSLYFNLEIKIHDLKGLSSFYLSYNTEAEITVIQEHKSIYGNGRGYIMAVVVPKKSQTIYASIRDYSRFNPQVIYTFKIEIEFGDDIEYQ